MPPKVPNLPGLLSLNRGIHDFTACLQGPCAWRFRRPFLLDGRRIDCRAWPADAAGPPDGRWWASHGRWSTEPGPPADRRWSAEPGQPAEPAGRPEWWRTRPRRRQYWLGRHPWRSGGFRQRPGGLRQLPRRPREHGRQYL